MPDKPVKGAVEFFCIVCVINSLFNVKRKKHMPYTLPTGFTLRRPTMNDIDIVVEMAHAAELADSGRIRTTAADLRSFWSLPSYNLAEDSWLVISPEGRLAAFTGVSHEEPASNMGAGAQVHPDYAHLGLYDYLIELALERADALIPTAPPGSRVTLSIWSSEKNASEHQSLEQAGFMHVRSNWLMEILMDQPPPAPVWPEGLELRPYTPDLLHAVFLADDDAFRDHWGRTTGNFDLWQLWTVKHEAFDPSLWFLVFADQEIAAFALCLHELDESWVGELGVRRSWRRKGLGLALLHQAFGEFYRRGDRRVVLNVDSQNLTGATRLYRRAGMHPFQQTDIYQKELRPGVELSVQELTL
jgi:mycothiol synthase